MQPEDRTSVPRLTTNSRRLLPNVIRPNTSYHRVSSTLVSRSSSLASSSYSTSSGHTHSRQLSEQNSSSLIDEARSSPYSSPTHSSSSSLSNTPHSFPITISEVSRRALKDLSKELEIIFKTAFRCYEALDYNQMIFVLQKVKIVPEMNPHHALAIHFGLGLGHYKQTSYEPAVLHLLKAEALAKEEAETKDDSGNLCLVSYYMGEVEYMQNKFLSAASYYETAVKVYKEKSVGDMYRVRVPPLFSLYCKCGTTLRYASKVMEAIKSYRKGVELSKGSHDLEGELSARTSLGNLYQSLGEFRKAVDEYHETLELADKLKDFVSLGWAHGNLGNAYLGMSKREKALHHLELALSITLEHEPVPQAIGRAYNNLGTAYQSLNDLDRAKEYYELALNQAIYGNDLPGQARVYGNLGNLLMLQNKFPEAIMHYTETLTISRDRATHITAYHNRGCARFERAETERKCYLEEGLDSAELLTGKKSNLVFIGTEVSDCEEEHRFLVLPDYLRKYYRDSQSDLERVVKHHEQTFQDIKGSQRGLSLSVSLFETNMRTFQRLQDCSFFLDQWQQALVYAEQSRARTLGELLLGKHSSRLKSSFRTPLDLPQIISIVKEQKLPVIYITYTGSRLLAWLLTPLDDSAPMSVSINLFQAALDLSQFQGKSFDFLARSLLSDSLIERQINMYDTCDYKAKTLLNELHELIAKPLLRLLKSVMSPEILSNLRDVLYIADSHTKLIPIAALQDPSSKEFLGDRFRFHSMNSLLTLGIIQQLPSSVVSIPLHSSSMCIVGNPSTPQFSYQGNTWNLGRLPFAEEEAQRVAHTLQASPILGNEALKDVILSKINQAKVVHLATHGSASHGFLIFAGSTRLKFSEDAFTKSILLFTEDLEELTIPAALVVLSSCDSGRGIVKVDGIQGIARSFLLAGAQAVLTSLWRVPDESASFFMHFFYRFLVDGLPSFTALQKAGHSIRCYSKYSGYIHWSGYQLQGREVQFDSNHSEESKRIKKVLGHVNVFPQLKVILKIKQSLLIDSKHENLHKVSLYPQRADVQLLMGSLEAHPQEAVVDYIAENHSLYTGGIYWIPGHTPDIVIASLQHMQEILCDNAKATLSGYFTSLDKPALLILDSFNSLPLSHYSLKVLMLKTNIHILLISDISSTPEKLKEETHTFLRRGIVEHDFKPLHCLSALQRLIYEIISRHEICPMNKEQKIFDKMEYFVAGQPVLIDITCALINDCMDKDNTRSPSDVMARFDKEVLDKTKKEYIEKAEEIEAKNKEASTSKYPVISSDKNVPSSDDESVYSKPAVIYTRVLLEFAPLNYWERLYLNCLTFIHSIPVHITVLKSLEKKLHSYCENEANKKELSPHLINYKFLMTYPHPVVQVTSSSHIKQPSSSEYFIIPAIVRDAVQSCLSEQEKFISCSLLYLALNDLSSSLANKDTFNNNKDINNDETLIVSPPSFTSLHCIALHDVLATAMAEEIKVFSKEVLVDVMETYVKEKLNAKGKESLAELIPEMEIP